MIYTTENSESNLKNIKFKVKLIEFRKKSLLETSEFQ